MNIPRDKRIFNAIVAGGLIALLTITYFIVSYVRSRPTEGEIVRKKYEPAHTWTQMVQVPSGQNCVGSGSTRSCTPTYIWVPQQHYDDADWIITIEKCVEEKCRKRRVYVTELEYDRLRVGDWFVIDKGAETNDPVDRRRSERDF